MNELQDAMNKIKTASRLIIGNNLYKYSEYQKIEPSGTIEQAWKNIGKHLQATIDTLKKENKND